jgi:hypothetical protein
MFTFYPTPDETKAQAKLLKLALYQVFGTMVQHSTCLEVIAKMNGLKDWNTLSAKIKPDVKRTNCKSPYLNKDLVNDLKAFDPNLPIRIRKECSFYDYDGGGSWDEIYDDLFVFDDKDGIYVTVPEDVNLERINR